jgi:hypothetical protein
MYEGGDGYEELPKCENIDNCNDIANMMQVCLRFFELVNTLKNDDFSKNPFLTENFGFDIGCENIFEYMKQTVIFKNDRKEIKIISNPRFTIS